jgi:hypothetical protein
VSTKTREQTLKPVSRPQTREHQRSGTRERERVFLLRETLTTRVTLTTLLLTTCRWRAWKLGFQRRIQRAAIEIP